MTDIGETISVPEVDGPWECPFDHEATSHDKKLSVSIDGKACDAKPLCARDSY